ncbi:MAG: cbb3-type cytochrome c oxidase subunit I, partial [Candidatus Obscuribacterales bacterium]|nr:cbb3-type cytochrome c oxidase subunit I [Candidatus Obscuribacterales bacterium]
MSSVDQSANILSESPPSIEYSLMKAHGIAALLALIFSALIGAFIAVKMHMPDMAGAHAFTTWGRLRYDHTQGIFFGWLGNAFLMFMYHAVPRLANRPVLSTKLGWLIFGIWNFAVLLPGWGLVLAGYSQALEWAEFPLVIDAFVVLSLILSVAQFVVPVLKARLSKLYVSGWYIIGGFIFTALAYPVGNIVPQLVPGAQGAAFSGLWIHDAIGLYVTPLALAMAYMVIPAVTKKPIYSHFLSMIGFWLLFFVYPLNGTHHYVFSAIPMEAQQAAIAASVLLGVDVILVVTNLLMSMKGSVDLFRQDLPLRFVCMGIIFYLIVSLQGSLQALMPVNKLVHFSDWVIGHSHLAMLGFASFVAIGGITHAWKQIPSAKYNNRALSHAYWLLLIGVIFMVLDLSLAGLVEANVWQSGLPWIESVREVRKLWVARSFVAIPIIGGFISLLVSMLTGPHNQTVIPVESFAVQKSHEQSPAQEAGATAGKRSYSILNMAYLSASVAGVGFFILSFGILAIAPGLAIESDLKKSKPVTMLPLTASENRGRDIYAREGCAYCHTQQVRAVASDVDRFGATTRAWETV